MKTTPMRHAFMFLFSRGARLGVRVRRGIGRGLLVFNPGALSGESLFIILFFIFVGPTAMRTYIPFQSHWG